MAYDLVRVIAQWIDDPTECVFMCDCCLDAQSGAMIGAWDVMGVIDHRQTRQRPFVLDAQGRMDFGAAAPDGARYWFVPLRQIALHVGVEFDITWPHGDCGRYRIEKIARLGSKGIEQHT